MTAESEHALTEPASPLLTVPSVGTRLLRARDAGRRRPDGRVHAFDTDFLTPAVLPPNTPMSRDLNTVGFA
jgi:hypothetical protein